MSNCIQIHGTPVGPENPLFIIGEVGLAHDGSLGAAHAYVDRLAKVGVDAVKFQTFKAENLVSKNAPKAPYQKNITSQLESQFSMLKKLELDFSVHKKLINYCKKKNLGFLGLEYSGHGKSSKNLAGSRIEMRC